VSRELTVEFGQAFTLRSLYRAIQFCQGFTDKEIVSTLSTQLSWSHFIELLPIKDPSARDFYAEMCRIERWDVRTLRLKIGGMLFQRTALSRKPQAVITAEIAKLRDGQMSPDTVFRDPYLLDLLGLKGAYSERDLESAILREIEGVLLELGTGFAFVGRQVPLEVGDQDFQIDLLFYHLKLRCHVVVELKAASELTKLDERQLLTYLKLSNRVVGLLINFNVLTLVEGVRRLVNGFPEEAHTGASLRSPRPLRSIQT